MYLFYLRIKNNLLFLKKKKNVKIIICIKIMYKPKSIIKITIIKKYDLLIFYVFKCFQSWVVANRSESKHFWHFEPILHVGNVEGNTIVVLFILRFLYLLFSVSIMNFKSVITLGMVLMYYKINMCIIHHDIKIKLI